MEKKFKTKSDVKKYLKNLLNTHPMYESIEGKDFEMLKRLYFEYWRVYKGKCSIWSIKWKNIDDMYDAMVVINCDIGAYHNKSFEISIRWKNKQRPSFYAAISKIDKETLLKIMNESVA